MDEQTLILYVVATVLSTIGFVMLYKEARKRRPPKKSVQNSSETPETKRKK